MPLIAFYSNSNSFPVFIVIFLPTIHFPLSLINIGGDKRVRTADLCLARAALSQLSYIPVAVLIVAIRGRYVNDYAGGMSGCRLARRLVAFPQTIATLPRAVRALTQATEAENYPSPQSSMNPPS